MRFFAKDELTDENKAFIKTLLGKGNYKDILGNIEDKYDQQKLIQGDQSVPVSPQAQPQPTATLNIPDLTPLKPTGIKSVDEKNWDNYIKLLEIYAPHMVVGEPGIIDGDIVPTIKTEIDDVVPTEPWLRPKTGEEIVEIDNIEPTEPWLRPEPIPVISQETVKLPKPIPKTDLPENINYVSAISDINKISPNSLIMSMETLTLTLLNKHLTMTMA